MDSPTSPSRSVVLLVTPGRMCSWTIEAAHYVAHSYGTLPVVFADTDTHIDPTGPATIYVSSYPSADLMRLALEVPSRALLIIEPLAEVIEHLLDHSGCTLPEAIRFAAASAARLTLAADSRRVPLVTSTNLDRGGLVQEILAIATGALVDHPLSAQTLAQFFPEPAAKPFTEAPERGKQLQFALAMLEPVYLRLAGGNGEHTVVTWPWQMLYSGDTLSSLTTSIIDITGPARILLYGPYLCLPAGHWTVSIVIAFSADAMDTPLLVGLYAAEIPLGEVSVRACAAGWFTVDFPVEVHDPTQPIELRIATLEGAIEGEIAVGRAEFTSSSG